MCVVFVSFILSWIMPKFQEILFNVPRYGLPGDAAPFEALFMTSDANGPGSSDSNPIELEEDITVFDFTSFLQATYPP
jgi:hypothetical protein